MPEVYILGEVKGARDLPFSKAYLHWKVVMNENNWSTLAGHTEGHTQIDATSEVGMTVWNHPIDMHFSTTSIEGWPKLILEVWRLDAFDRHEIAGYGTCFLPTVSGDHYLECAVWRPYGSWTERVTSFLLGSPTQLKYSDSLILSSQRDQMQMTETLGGVCFSLKIITLGFETHGTCFGT
mmetsp:Transcript_31948/g.42173  ORF Transcript_31948/g.42173 Transcript_31948/m.42173 type:complete len:180 (-) Transcript_31948:243-782(-)